MNPESEMSSGTDSLVYNNQDDSYEAEEIVNEPGEYTISLLQAIYINKIMPEGYKIESEEALNTIIEEEPLPLVGKKRRMELIQVI